LIIEQNIRTKKKYKKHKPQRSKKTLARLRRSRQRRRLRTPRKTTTKTKRSRMSRKTTTSLHLKRRIRAIQKLSMILKPKVKTMMDQNMVPMLVIIPTPSTVVRLTLYS